MHFNLKKQDIQIQGDKMSTFNRGKKHKPRCLASKLLQRCSIYLACLATISRIVSLLFQFYKCFRQLFHCQPPSSTDGEPTCHSKVTVIQLNQKTDGGKLCNNKPRPETDNKVTSLLHPEPGLEPAAKTVPPM